MEGQGKTGRRRVWLWLVVFLASLAPLAPCHEPGAPPHKKIAIIIQGQPKPPKAPEDPNAEPSAIYDAPTIAANVKEMTAVLTAQGFTVHTVATKKEFTDFLGTLQSGANQLGANDELFVYYTGHGYRTYMPPGEWKKATKRNDPKDFVDDHAFGLQLDVQATGWDTSTMMTATEFRQAIEGVAQRTSYVGIMIDACYAGGFRKALERVPGVEVFQGSSAANETSYVGAIGKGNIEVKLEDQAKPITISGTALDSTRAESDASAFTHPYTLGVKDAPAGSCIPQLMNAGFTSAMAKDPTAVAGARDTRSLTKPRKYRTHPTSYSRPTVAASPGGSGANTVPAPPEPPKTPPNSEPKAPPSTPPTPPVETPQKPAEQPLPKADLRASLIGVVLPTDRKPGETISGRVVLNPEDYAQNPAFEVVRMQVPLEQSPNGRATLHGVVVDTGNGRHQSAEDVIKLTVPGGTTAISLLAGREGTEMTARQTPATPSAPRPEPPVQDTGQPADYQMPPVCTPGTVQTVHGPFTGDAARTRVEVNDRPATIVAETPRAVYWQVPQSKPGAIRVTVREERRGADFQPYVLGLAMSADQTQLMRGQSTTFHVSVTGMENVPGSVWRAGGSPQAADREAARRLAPDVRPPAAGEEGFLLLTLENVSKETITINGSRNARGEVVVLQLKQADFAGAPYRYDGVIHSKRSGGFDINGSLVPFLAPLVGQSAK